MQAVADYEGAKLQHLSGSSKIALPGDASSSLLESLSLGLDCPSMVLVGHLGNLAAALAPWTLIFEAQRKSVSSIY